jgi:hypothetical protein
MAYTSGTHSGPEEPTARTVTALKLIIGIYSAGPTHALIDVVRRRTGQTAVFTQKQHGDEAGVVHRSGPLGL